MNDPVFFDVETYIDKAYCLGKMAEIQYIRDPRFELLSVGAEVEGQVKIWRGDDTAWLDQFKRWNAEGRRFIAHNARFDLRVLWLAHGFKPLLSGDTLSMARYLWFGKHSLDHLAQKLFGVGKQGTLLSGIRLKAMTPTQWRDLARYNAVDVILCRRLWREFIPLLPPSELELINQTLFLQLRPQRIDLEAASALADRCGEKMNLIASKYPCLSELANCPVKLREYIQESYGAELDSVDKKKVGEIIRFGPDTAEFLEGLWAFKSDRKTKKDVETLATRMGIGNNRVLVDLNYCGAHSHRWSSGGGGGASSFNYQNLSRSGGIRELNIPQPGKLFIIGDLAQIEARITAWLADETGQLKIFRENGDIYCDFASPLFGRPVTKTDKVERKIGKEAVLGLGFGMGAKLFAERLRTQTPESLKLLCDQFSEKDPVEAARRVVDEYRGTYSRIHDNAKRMFRTLLHVVERPDDGNWPVGNWIRIMRDGDHVVVRLPSGGFLTYRDVGVMAHTTDYGTQTLPTYLGRKITFSMPIENAVQSLARDIFARALLELERAGFEIAFHIHDEVVVEIEAPRADEKLELFKQIFGAEDPKCPGLPIACEAYLSDKYTKNEDYMMAFTKRNIGHPIEELAA
ncbi:MAG: DNA polymerase [Phycisphaerae bacterium]